MSVVQHWCLAVLVMGVITFLLRALPLAVWRQLGHSRIADALNRRLPLCVMVILLCASLKGSPTELTQLAAEIVALAGAGLSYLQWRNPLISVIVGVATLNVAGWALPH